VDRLLILAEGGQAGAVQLPVQLVVRESA